jgi:hypothetical protein
MPWEGFLVILYIAVLLEPPELPTHLHILKSNLREAILKSGHIGIALLPPGYLVGTTVVEA